MRITTEPRSDQWNADDFIGGPRDFTIAGVKVGSAEQKYDIELVEGEGRVWRPPLTVLRQLVAGWSDDATTWVGRRVRLYRDPSIRFGRDSVGGIRVSHMSHLPDNKPLSIMLTESRGKRTNHVVEPMPAGRVDHGPAPDNLAAQSAAMVAHFKSALGVTEQQLVQHIALPVADWTAETLAALKVLGGQIKSGEKTVAGVFGGAE